MTEKLYYKDAYTREFYAEAIAVENSGEKFDVVLDRTAFFPEEGGQYSDTGTIDGLRVVAVYEKDGIVHHLCDGAPRLSERLDCRIDFDERFEKMQCHTAEHILSGLFHKYYGLENVGFHLGKEDVTMDISAPLDKEALEKIEALANEIVYKNVEVTTKFPRPEELENLTYRSKLDLTENVRIVDIGEYDSCACCAPHVSFTGEIGAIKIFEYEKLRGGMRIHILAGRRAMRRISDMYKGHKKISAMLSTPISENDIGVENLLNNLAKIKAEYDKFRLNSFIEKVENTPTTDGNRVLYFKEANLSELREIANSLISRVGKFLVLLSGEDGRLSYVIASESVDLRAELPKINAALNGKGGGKGIMASGNFSVSREAVADFFK